MLRIHTPATFALYLLSDIIARGTQELHEDGNSSMVDHDTGVVRCSRCDIR
jgi:hypothetical protein